MRAARVLLPPVGRRPSSRGATGRVSPTPTQLGASRPSAPASVGPFTLHFSFVAVFLSFFRCFTRGAALLTSFPFPYPPPVRAPLLDAFLSFLPPPPRACLPRALVFYLTGAPSPYHTLTRVPYLRTIRLPVRLTLHHTLTRALHLHPTLTHAPYPTPYPSSRVLP
ncbi:hypothetical protein FB451DRAFT_1246976 [Mycena latifolia]|nr:hypothetical protein FB451DRAFT_1246976 [Mycena latifolia]